MQKLEITGMKNITVGISKTLPHFIGFYFIELWITLGVRSIHISYFLIIIISSNLNILDKDKLLNTELKIISFSALLEFSYKQFNKSKPQSFIQYNFMHLYKKNRITK